MARFDYGGEPHWNLGVVLLFSFFLQVECLGRLIPFFWMTDCIGVWKWLIGAVNINSASFTGDYCR